MSDCDRGRRAPRAVSLLLLMLLLVLLAAACGGGEAVDWQASSPTAPTYDPMALPRLLVQPRSGSGELLVVDLVTGHTRTLLLTRAPSLDSILAEEHQVVGDLLAGRQEQFFGLTSGAAAPNGLWLAAAGQDGLRLVRVDGASMLLSAQGSSPVWSPDGLRLAYRDADGLWAVDVSADLTLQRLSATAREPLAWTADNRQLLLRDGRTLTILDSAIGQENAVCGVDASQIRGRPVWSSNGQEIFARYGNNGLLSADPASLRQPDNVQARLVAIAAGCVPAPVRDLLPNQRNLGTTDFMPTPDGDLLLARHFVCRTQLGSELIPLIPQRSCSAQVLLVDSATGNYQTISNAPLTGAMAWENALPAVDLASLPLPVSAGESAATAGLSFWQPDAAPGHNPATAIPLGETGQRLGTLTTIVEVLEGDAALALAKSAAIDPPLLAPGPGYAYVAVRQRVSTDRSGSAAIFRSPGSLLLDDRLAAQGEAAWLDAQGQAIQELRYSADAPSEYWQLFILEEGARPWLLVAPGGADNLPDLYYRLDETAEWVEPASTVSPVPANTVGVATPAGIGEMAVSDDWQITLLAPDAAVRPASAPELALVEIAYTGDALSADRLLICLGSDTFQDVAGSRVVRSEIIRPLPFQHFNRTVCFLPGGKLRGWLAVVSPSPQEPAVFRFNPPRPLPAGERLFTFQ